MRLRRPSTSDDGQSTGQVEVSLDTSGVVYRSQGFPLFPGTFRVVATHPQLTVRVLRSDGTELCAGSGASKGTLDRAEFGVIVELSADPPLTESVVDVAISVEIG